MPNDRLCGGIHYTCFCGISLYILIALIVHYFSEMQKILNFLLVSSI